MLRRDTFISSIWQHDPNGAVLISIRAGMMAQAELALESMAIPKSNVHQSSFTLPQTQTTEGSRAGSSAGR